MKMYGRRIWPIMVLSLFSGIVVQAQGRIDFGVMNPKLSESKEVGIGSYRLVQEEPNSYRVTVWDREGADLADCDVELEIQYTQGTCRLVAGGVYRMTWDGEQEVGSFEDLETGEAITVRFEWTSPPPEGLIELAPGEELPVPEGDWIVEGSKTKAEVERDWGDIPSFVGKVVGEVLQTLGIPGIVREAGTDGAVQGPGESFACGPGQFRQCTGQGGVIGSGVSIDEARCCSAASQDADVSCLWVSRTFCCANSVCTVHGFFGLFVRCNVGGLIWRCVDCV